MLKPRALLFAFIGMIAIGSVVFYCSMPEKQAPDPRYSIRTTNEKIEWYNGDTILQLQNTLIDESEGYHTATIQRQHTLISKNGERLTLWIYLRSLQYYGSDGYAYEVIEYQFLLRYPDKTITEYVNAVILYDEEGDEVFDEMIILGKINFKLHLSRYMNANERDDVIPSTTVQLYFSPVPEETWTLRRTRNFVWNKEMERQPLLVSFSDDGSAAVPTHFSMEMFIRDDQ